ncbi:MAG TPA: ribosomal-processing cysteine protease Prp [Acholeplasma sp.]|jgi:uncharacterized protein YsxB (DUF464 family)|nr:ribosomal-processing cysteine protease Prp [Acholeplasma sp.]
MIYCSVKKNPYEIKVEGHADFARLGKDIVCASVSTAIILSANLIKRFDQEKNVEIKISEGYFHLKVKTLSKEIEAVCENLVWTMKELEKTYPNNIKYQEER